MSIKNKFFAIITALCIFVSPLQVSATEASHQNQSVDSIMQMIKEKDENAIVEYENGAIHVISEVDPYTSSNTHSRSTSARSYYAPNGGSWYDFTPPSYISIMNGATLPYCVVYLPGDLADKLYIAMTKPSFWDYLIGNPISATATTALIETMKAKILAKFAISLTTAELLFLCSDSCIFLYETVNKDSLARVISATEKGKVRIDYTTINDTPVNYYYSWADDNDYVTDHPWSDFNPSFLFGCYLNMSSNENT